MSKGRLRIVDNPKKIIPYALNIGIQASKGRIIVRLDGHSFIERDYLSNIIVKFNTSDASCIGPKMIMLSINSAVSQAIAESLAIPFGPGTSGFRYSDKEQYADTMNFGAYKAELFNEVGLFNTTLLANEDYEMHYRIRKAGHKILYSPTLKVYYYVRDSFRQLAKQYFRYGYWKSKMLLKWPNSIKLRHLVAPVFVIVLFSGFILSIMNNTAKIFFVCTILLYLLAALFFSINHLQQNKKLEHYLLVPLIIFSFFVYAYKLGVRAFGQVICFEKAILSNINLFYEFTMRIVIVTQEEPFYLPPALFNFCSKRKKDIVGIIILKAFNESLTATAHRLFDFYGPIDFSRLFIRYCFAKIADKINKSLPLTRPYSIEDVAIRHGIHVYKPDKMNNNEFVNILSNDIRPDLMVSIAASQVIKKSVLDIPILGCINLHSAPLPKYQGMMPNFWTMAHNEPNAGHYNPLYG